MHHMWLMDLINLAFLFASTLFWWPIVGLDPIPHWQMSHGAKLASLLIGVPIESFLALALLSTIAAGGVRCTHWPAPTPVPASCGSGPSSSPSWR